MTDREKAIVMAYTGYCMLAGDKLKVFYEYVGELLGRPVHTHEFADPDIQKKATNDFYNLCKETTPEDMDDLQKEMSDVRKRQTLEYQRGYKDAKRVYEQRWIPCSERLPEEYKVVLITAFRTDKTFNQIPYLRMAYYCDGFWYPIPQDNTMFPQKIEDFDGGEPCVTAWMPLPESWKGGTDDN